MPVSYLPHCIILGKKILNPGYRYSILGFRSAVLANNLQRISFWIHCSSSVVCYSTTAKLIVVVHLQKRCAIRVAMSYSKYSRCSSSFRNFYEKSWHIIHIKEGTSVRIYPIVIVRWEWVQFELISCHVDLVFQSINRPLPFTEERTIK